MMTHKYNLTGMTCSSCESKVKSALLIMPDVTAVEVNKDDNSATISMENHISVNALQEALGGKDSKYKISALQGEDQMMANEAATSWFETYKPIVLIFAYITLISFIASYSASDLNWMTFMRVFMAGFFLTFSFFKMLNLKGFAESYAMYDLVAKKIPVWGYIYAFVELGLGIAFAINFEPVLTNWITLVVMTISIMGVLESVFNKKKIRCACLGAVFNLPMSTVTIVEDALMILMSALMLILM
jgi:copper chaperone CopZ